MRWRTKSKTLNCFWFSYVFLFWNPETYKEFYLQLITEYPSSESCLSLKVQKQEGVAVVAVSTKCISNRHSKPFTCQLLDDSCISIAELQAILVTLTLKHVYCSKGGKKLDIVWFSFFITSYYIQAKVWPPKLSTVFRTIVLFWLYCI